MVFEFEPLSVNCLIEGREVVFWVCGCWFVFFVFLCVFVFFFRQQLVLS